MKTKAMKSPGVNVLVLAAVFLFTATVSQAQSAYSNAVMALNPVAYWPLQENVQPPRYDMETNYGQLGALANGYYYSSAVIATNAGPIAGDTDGSRYFTSGGNAGMLVPTTDNRVSLPAGGPFTVELWMRPTEATTYCGIVDQTAGIGSGGLNGTANDFGWSLCQGYAAYRGTGSGNNPPIFGFHVFNGQSNLGGAEADVTNAVSGAGNEWLSGSYVGSWIYVACVFDGTNAWMYMFSTNLTAAYSGTNAMDYQCPIASQGGQNDWAPPALYPSAQFMPDTWDPIIFGETRNYSGNHNWGGNIDEVAIYTNALTFTQITNHYAYATNGTGQYFSTVMGDRPYMYWRMDAPAWTPVLNGFPTAANYGSAVYNMTNFNTGGSGLNASVYQPGTRPGVPGPSYPGFGALTNACAFNGLAGAVDAGYNGLLNPTGAFNNFTLVAWYKGNPMDTLGGRYNCLASKGSASPAGFVEQFHLGTAYGYKGVGGQPSVAPTAAFNPNDGKWHMFTLVASAVPGGTGTNVSIYLDSGIYSATVANPSAITGNTLDLNIGCAPDVADKEPTNYASYNSSEQDFAGEIAHVAFFTNALAFNQIQNLFFTAQPAPVISKQPVGGNADLGGAFTNTVSVQGTGPFFYQWYTTNSGLIGGATSQTYTINPVLTTSGGGYYVVVTNIYGSVTSLVVNVTVVSNLTITAQYPITYTAPITLYGGTNIEGTNYLGSTPTFSVTAAGATPIYYQWETNGVAVGGANGSTFTVTNCQLGSPTNFICVITNAFGSVTSMVWSASYIPTTTAPFPQAVLAEQPISYWRLNDGPDNGNGNIGAVCTDYQSGNNGLYTNVVLADADSGPYPIFGYDPITDPTETSALFGAFSQNQDYVGGIGTNIDFATPVGGNAEFTVAVWANGGAGNEVYHVFPHGQVGNAGLVTKGHWGAEQFTLDTGSSTVDCLRFTVRDALTGNYYSANSSVNLGNDANWHYVVGVCDEANSQILLYVDGQLAGSGVLAAGSGVLNVGPVEVMIGARDNGSGVLGGIQFNGWLNDVALYNYAFTAGQVLSNYDIAGIPAYFVQQPVGNIDIDGGGTLVVPANVGGTPPLTMQWFDENANSYIPGQTSNTLVVPNIAANDTYYLTASNSVEGIGFLTNSTSVNVTVHTGAPQVSVDVTNPFYALPGQTAKNAATVYGELPLAYQWQFYGPTGWANLMDNGRISGSQTSTLTIGSVQGTDPGNYQLVITNIYGATTSSVASLIVQGVLPLGFGNGAGWTTTGFATFSSGLLTLTYGSSSPGGYFFQIPQYIGAFEASFTYQAQYDSTVPYADGITFCLQDDPRGASATGSGGGDLGYTGISPSAALEMNIYPSYGVGYAFGVDGTINQYASPGSVNFTNGAVDVSLLYADGQLALTFSNELTANVFSTNIYVGNIPQYLGSSTAYVGFTGAFGGSTSVQTIQNFQFISIPPQAIQKVGNHAIITWPGSIVADYTVQENSSITTTNWVNMTNAVPIVTNGVNQATVPIGSGNQQYYRLILSQP